MSVRGVAAAAGVAAALALTSVLPVSGASAAVDDVPEVRVKIRSITLASYSGTLAVLARVRCTPKVDGVGTASWSVKAVQEVRARAKAPITCDGKKRVVGMRLVPRQGRFESGTLSVQLTTLAEGTNGATATGIVFTTTI